jgi:hypothetical protein
MGNIVVMVLVCVFGNALKSGDFRLFALPFGLRGNLKNRGYSNCCIILVSKLVKFTFISSRLQRVLHLKTMKKLQ